MQLLTPVVPDPRALLARANPVAKLAAALVVMVALFASLDWLTSAVILGALLALVPATGIPPATLARRTWPLILAAVSIGLFNIVFAAEQQGPIELRKLGDVRLS